jgi:hypothetical protein
MFSKFEDAKDHFLHYWMSLVKLKLSPPDGPLFGWKRFGDDYSQKLRI